MNDLVSKKYVVEMLSKGFVLAPCANSDCEQLFASDTYCTMCEVA
jgi:hypothetical protein